VVQMGVSNWWSPKIWGSSRRDVYILSGSGAVHFDGTSWSAVPALPWGYGIWGTSASDVYAATYGILRFDGVSWNMMTGSTGSANALWGSSSSEIYAVRNAGELSAWNGSTWSPFASVSDRDLWNAWGSSTGSVYAVGYNWSGINAGVIMRGVRGATVMVTPSTPTITGLGTTQQLTATGYAGGTPVPGVAFSWSSSNPAVATVSATGLVTAVGAGTATITATAPGGASAGTLVTVSP
jgi:Bacterial Ig-like domain (group 2)